MKKDHLYFVFIDYKSLFSIKSLAPLLDSVDKSHINNVVLSIDIDGIETSEYTFVIETISLLKELGFKIRLDKLSNKIATHFVEETNPNYIKIATQEWNIAYFDEHKSTLTWYGSEYGISYSSGDKGTTNGSLEMAKYNFIKMTRVAGKLNCY